MSKLPLRPQSVGIFLIAMATLMVEILLTRVLDVTLSTQIGYMVITCAMFAIGLAGVYATIRPLKPGTDISLYLARLAGVFAISLILMRPLMNFNHYYKGAMVHDPIKQVIWFALLYITLLLPFFFAGLIFTRLFSAYASKIRTLYCWDLCGAAIGCVIIIPFIPYLGPGGLIYLAATGSLLASALFAYQHKGYVTGAVVAALITATVPLLTQGSYHDFTMHGNKRQVDVAMRSGQIEFTRWDPISRIDVIPNYRTNPATGKEVEVAKHIAYDGGTQSSHFFKFDGDFAALRERVDRGDFGYPYQFWHRGVILSHYIKADSQAKVLIIGSAGGQETKAALIYNAAHVDGVELVETVVDLGKKQYAEYSGNIFLDPRVNNVAGEGRSYLRATDQTYDIIQIHSNHTSSSIASGTGAVQTTYLQTAQAYHEYFTHLNPDGILHINHHVYPRMVTTAALAWQQLGKKDMARHTLIFQRQRENETLPTLLIKMSPWTKEQVQRATAFMIHSSDEPSPQALVYDPTDPANQFLPEKFFNAPLAPDIIADADYLAYPSTDDRPYFNFLQKRFRPVEASQATYTPKPTADLLNKKLIIANTISADYRPFVILGGTSVFLAIGFVVLPLLLSKVGREPFDKRFTALNYFSCLGLGFIIIELTLIHLFMKLIGSPLHTYGTIIFVMLFAAGLGSVSAQWLDISPHKRWAWPFVGIVLLNLLLILLREPIIEASLIYSLYMRCLIAAACVFPASFFMGMPFPLGILAIEKQPAGAIAWAWGMNGLFTVIGGIVSVGFSIFWGFTSTLYLAIAIYILAGLFYARLRHAACETSISKVSHL